MKGRCCLSRRREYECPICLGTGKVSPYGFAWMHPPGYKHPGGLEPKTCKVCDGSGKFYIIDWSSPPLTLGTIKGAEEGKSLDITTVLNRGKSNALESLKPICSLIVELFGDQPESPMLIAQAAGLNPAYIPIQRTTADQWWSVLVVAQKARLVHKIALEMEKRYPERSEDIRSALSSVQDS